MGHVDRWACLAGLASASIEARIASMAGDAVQPGLHRQVLRANVRERGISRAPSEARWRVFCWQSIQADTSWYPAQMPSRRPRGQFSTRQPGTLKTWTRQTLNARSRRSTGHPVSASILTQVSMLCAITRLVHARYRLLACHFGGKSRCRRRRTPAEPGGRAGALHHGQRMPKSTRTSQCGATHKFAAALLRSERCRRNFELRQPEVPCVDR